MVFKRLQQATRLAENRKGVAVPRRLHLRICRTLHFLNGLEHQCAKHVSQIVRRSRQKAWAVSAGTAGLSQASWSNSRHPLAAQREFSTRAAGRRPPLCQGTQECPRWSYPLTRAPCAS